MRKYFRNETHDWAVVHARTYFTAGIISELETILAQITMRYKDKDNNVHYIIFERPLNEKESFHSWRVLAVDYQYSYL